MLALEARGAGVDVIGPVQNVPGSHEALEAVLDVTAGATEASDTLDVTIQAFVGGVWVDVIHFSQVLGNAAVKRYFAKICGPEPQAMFEDAAALAAGSVRHLLSDSYRVKHTIVDGGGAAASFTFSVKANYYRRK